MKKQIIIGLLTILISSSVLAQTPEEKQILYNIDSICGDTWCSNPDYTFTFEKLEIKNNTAHLYFTTYKVILKKNDKGEDYEHHEKYLKDVCVFQIVPDENLEDLTDDTMEAIGDCLFPME